MSWTNRRKFSLDRRFPFIHTSERSKENNTTELQLSTGESATSVRKQLVKLRAMCRFVPKSKKSTILSNLGDIYHRLYQETGDATDLDNSISLKREAVQLGYFHPQQIQHLKGLSSALKDRYKCRGNRADIDQAIQASQTALGLTQRDTPERVDLLKQLAWSYDSRFDRLGDVTDINMAVSIFSEAVASMPEGSLDKAECHKNLSRALFLRFQRIGELEDLDKAIVNMVNTVSLMPDGHPEKPSHYSNLGIVLQSRFERLGNLSDLETAISYKENCVSLMPNWHPEKPFRYTSLGWALLLRFNRLGDLGDLSAAIFNLENAANLTPNEDPEKPSRYGNLGSALIQRFRRLGDLADLNNAIFNQERAVSLTPLDGHPNKHPAYTNLGATLLARYAFLGDLADLNEAISNLEIALKLTPDEHPEKPSIYNNLGATLLIRSELLGDLADLDKAIFIQENAVSLIPDGQPDKATKTLVLARCYESRFNSSAKRSDLNLAHSLYATAAKSPAGYPNMRFQAALGWSQCAKLKKSSPLLAFRCAINQLPRIAWVGIPVSEQHSLLEEIGEGIRDAVAAAIDAEEYEMAVEWMEQGRSIVWQNLLKLRAPVDDLRAVYPEIATQLQSISQQLDAPASCELMPPTRQEEHPQEIATSQASLAIEWDATIDQIRRLPNFGSFLKPKGFESIAPVAHDGPVVILNVAKDRCDALALVSDGSSVVATVPISLENLSLDKSIELLGGLRKLLALSGVRDGDMRAARRVGSKADPNVIFKSILRTLWVDIVKPVMDGLAYQPCTEDMPRIWWCATGALAFLPIHAAGDYDTTEVGHKVFDYVVSSYTPTLTAILDLSYPSSSKDLKLLTVAQPSAPSLSEIPKTMDEVEKIAKVANGISVLQLAKEEATIERVQQGMRESNWIHLACHGKQDGSKPLDSGLILHDGTLKLSTIVKETLPNAEFAFLSACQTAMGDEKVMEEAAHLAAGMLLVGYKGIIATMWSIRDDIAPQVTEVVYSRMLKDGNPDSKEAAYALHEAVKQLRDSGASFTSWVPFIHIGR